MTDDVTFGPWLKRQRRLLDLTQEELASRLGYAVTTIRRIEADELRPSKALAEKLAEALALPTSDRPAFLKFARGERGAALPLPRPAAVPTAAAAPVTDASFHTTLPARHNLPVQISSFVGRTREMDRLQALLGISRLVTLTGVGGTGKTRLALETATRLVEDFPNGVWLVELAPLMDAALLPQAVAQVFTLRDDSGRPPLETLTDYLRPKHLLLILDNCEHLIDAASQISDSLLHACPQLHILATSREALGITGETVFQVPSLSLPDRATPLPDVPATLDQFEAIRLFVDRASTVHSGFITTDENLQAIAHICRTLDGIPLAIELAAARVRTLPLTQIAARIDDRFRLLTGGSRVALSRQRTLQGLIDWSYSLLTEAERRLLRRLAVFSGGWTLEAAEAVFGENEDVFDLLSRLVEKSLIIVQEMADHTRYTMLETIRQYALDKLNEADEGEHVLERHLAYYLKLGEEGGPQLQRGDQFIWLKRLEVEIENIRAAIRWSLDAPSGNARPEMGLRLAWALFWYWGHTGSQPEAARYYESFLALPIGQAPTASRALALLGAHWQGSRGEDTAYITESIALFRQVGNKRGLAWALVQLGLSESIYSLNFPAAEAMFAEAAALFQDVKDYSGLAFVRLQQGLTAVRQGHYAVARTFQQESAAHYKTLGDRIYYSVAISHIGMTDLREGNYAAARAHFNERLLICREGGGAYNVRAALLFMGTAALYQGDYEEALDFFKEGQALCQQLGLLEHGLEPVSMGETYRLMGNPSEAVRLFREVLCLPIRSGFGRQFVRWSTHVALRGMAALALAAGNEVRAARLLGATIRADAIIVGPGLPAGHTYTQDQATARARLGDAAFEVAWAEGQAMTLEEAIAYALENTTPHAIS